MPIMSEDKTRSRREKRIAERKSNIMQAAADTFARKGFHNTTTKEIAEAADVAEGTIYNYFDSKEDLLLQIFDYLADMEGRRRYFEEVPSDDFRDFFVEHIRARITRLREDYTMFLAVLPEIINTPTLRERYYEQFVNLGLQYMEDFFHVRAKKFGDVREIDISLAMRLILSLTLGMQVLIILGDTQLREAWEKPDKLAHTLVTLILDGMMQPRESPSDKDPGQSDG